MIIPPVFSLTFTWVMTIVHNKTRESKHCTNQSLFILADKICDQVSDAVLDAHLKIDPDAKVSGGCQCLFFHLHVLAGVRVEGILLLKKLVMGCGVDEWVQHKGKGIHFFLLNYLLFLFK